MTQENTLLDIATIVEVEGVSKYYKQGNRLIYALQDVSLSVYKGDVYGIIGLSGAGKSTLIRSLARLVRPSAGNIFFNGVNITAMEGRALRTIRKNMGMIFQHFNLLHSRTVAGNIAYPLEIAKVCKEKRQHRVDELLSLVNLTDKKDAYPQQLSGGEKQRVGIARALANHPELLLCDEATSALDPKTTRDILSLLKTINKKLGVTIVLITHEMDVIKHICNKVAVIEKGEIVEKGIVSDIFSDPKHTTTKHFLHSASHELPPEFLEKLSSRRKLLRLKFKGNVTHEPIISQIIKKCNIEVNILLGWIDYLQTMILGSLVVELIGSPEHIELALLYLQQQSIHYEVIARNER